MSAQANLARQWLPLAKGSCDVRMGYEAISQSSSILKGAVGRPRACIVVARASADTDLIEEIRRQLVDAGYTPCRHTMPDDMGASMEACVSLAQACAANELTGDDLCCALGDADLLSVASFVCESWCEGMALVALPVDETAFLEGALAPRSLSVGGREAMMDVRACARHVVLDYGLMLSDKDAESAKYARALMVATAMASSEREFSELWDRVSLIMGQDEGEFATQLLTTAKSRGQIASSNAAATRQSLGYGQTFARALRGLLAKQGETRPYSTLLAEGLRFSARIAVMLDKLSIDDMLAQDELLDSMELGSLTCDISARGLIDALKQERFARSNRFMLPVPIIIGRVRLTTIEDDMLLEHAKAWCDAHRP